MTLDGLGDQRAYFAKVLKEAHEKITKEPEFLSDTLASTNGHIEQINEAFTEFRRLHFEMRAFDKGNEQATTAQLQTYEGYYRAAKAKLNERVNELQRPAENSLNMTLGGSIIRVETNRPPEIPKFDGTASKWPAFRDMFRAEVNNREFDNVTKLRYLQQACVKRAASTLGIWKPTAENYEAAWAHMQSKYSDDHRITQSLLDDIFTIQKQVVESHDGIRTIIDVTTSTLRQLEVLGIATTSWDEIIIHIITARLPAETWKTWEQKRIGFGQSPTLSQLFEFLEAKASGRRFIDEQQPQEAEQYKHNPGPSRSAMKPQHGHNNQHRTQRYQPYDNRNAGQSNQGYQKVMKCSFCNGPHLSAKCRDFVGMTLNERRDKVQTVKACNCCFGKGHRAMQCRLNGCGTCPDSVPKHHALICKLSNRPQ